MPPPVPAEGEGGADDEGEADVGQDLAGIVHVVDDAGAGDLEPIWIMRSLRPAGLRRGRWPVGWRRSSGRRTVKMPRFVAGDRGVRPVCPPSVGRTASIGCSPLDSRSRIFSTASGVMGSM